MKKVNIKPLGEHILIQPQKPEKKTETGLYLPDTADNERSYQGRVVAVGESDKIVVKPGQTVVYGGYGHKDVKSGGEEYLIVKNEDVLAVVE
jgi:chaperonin GroES